MISVPGHPVVFYRQYPGRGQRCPVPPLLCSALVPRLVDQLVLRDPRHHRAQLLADRFDLVLGGQATAARFSVGAPARFSMTKLLAYSPVWMSRQHLPSSTFLVSSVTMRGPVTYSPYSALFEIE